MKNVILAMFCLVALTKYCMLVESKKSTDQLKFKMLGQQLSSLRGIKRFRVFTQDHVDSRIMKGLHVELSRTLPTMFIDWREFKSTNVTRTATKAKARKQKRQKQSSLSKVSGDEMLVYVVSTSRTRKQLDAIRIYRSLAFPANLPKVLLISLTDQVMANYKSTFNYLLEQGNIVDVDILEIYRNGRNVKARKVPRNKSGKNVKGTKAPRSGSKDGKNGKARRRVSKSSSSRYTVHMYNPFTRQYKKQKLTKNVRWFQEKVRNLHGYKVFTSDTKPATRSYALGKRIASIRREFANSRFGKLLKTSMNFTYGYKKVSREQDVIFKSVVCDASNKIATLKPCAFNTHFIYTPVIYDTFYQVDIGQFFVFFPLIFAINILLKLCSSVSEFSLHTWSWTYTFNMLLGRDNPSGITGKCVVESLLLCLLYVGGFFFSNEFSEAATGIVNPVRIERNFHSFQDLKDSNLTLYLMRKYSCHGEESEFVIDEIIRANVKYNLITEVNATVFRALSKMLHSKLAMSCQNGPETIPWLTDTFNLDGKTLAKKSYLNEYKVLLSYPVKSYSPFYERMSDLYWRFFEIGDHIYGEYKTYWRLIINQHLYDLYSEEADDEITEDFDETRMLAYIFFGVSMVGSIAAILALLVEILISKM